MKGPIEEGEEDTWKCRNSVEREGKSTSRRNGNQLGAASYD